VNGRLLHLQSKPQIVANPNCSTIQLVVTLKPLDDQFGIKEVRVATYQAVSGAGQAGHDELMEQTQNYQSSSTKTQTFPHPILFNVIPQIGSFNEEGFCSEEIKIQTETKKILSRPDLKISAFTVRVPALNAHSEAVWITLNKKIERHEFIKALSESPGLVVQDEPSQSIYPLAREASGKDPVYVGRIHRDSEDPYLWLLWIVSDNVRKGAALNGIQIAEKLF
jgi:aspartate-semialdehyde dehydrogenase